MASALVLRTRAQEAAAHSRARDSVPERVRVRLREFRVAAERRQPRISVRHFCHAERWALRPGDFSYNMLFLRGVHDRTIARPYQMEGQAQMARIILPESGSGMHHAYSPVSFDPHSPASLRHQFPGLYRLFHHHRRRHPVADLLLSPAQPSRSRCNSAFLAIALPSVATMEALVVGQTAMLTTVLIGALWILLRRRQQSTGHPLVLDLALALLFWTICFKPSIGFVPFILLAGRSRMARTCLGARVPVRDLDLALRLLRRILDRHGGLRLPGRSLWQRINPALWRSAAAGCMDPRAICPQARRPARLRQSSWSRSAGQNEFRCRNYSRCCCGLSCSSVRIF